MFYGESIRDTRAMFYSSWQKHKHNQPLSPLEQQIVAVIIIHPDYHPLFETTSAQTLSQEPDQENPFLHLGLHMAIRDQVQTNRPFGITSIFEKLMEKIGDRSTVEHLLMDPLAQTLWQAQREQSLPDEVSYLNTCRQLLVDLR